MKPSSEPKCDDEKASALLGFVDALAALYADLWHVGKLDDMVNDANGPPEDE